MIGKVLVGMSGGVDSSVAVYLLKEQGFEVTGATLKFFENQDMRDAKETAEYLGIKHVVIDVREIFSQNVKDYFIGEYEKGRTPSPCLMCNEKVKFKYMFDYAENNGIDFIGTGHYADIEYFQKYNTKAIRKAKDISKDQSYLIYRLSGKELEKILFPLAGIEKTEVREIARKAGIKSYEKKDSQDLCFAPEGYIEFIYNNTKKGIKKGNFLDNTGKIIGEHRGYQFYTVGQRRGLGLDKGRPYFVTRIIPEKNIVVLGNFDELLTEEIEAEDLKFLFFDIKEIDGLEVLARPRYSSKGNMAKISILNENKIKVLYKKKNAENTEGQHVVFYIDDFVIGGGIISNINL